MCSEAAGRVKHNPSATQPRDDPSSAGRTWHSSREALLAFLTVDDIQVPHVSFRTSVPFLQLGGESVKKRLARAFIIFSDGTADIHPIDGSRFPLLSSK